MVAPSEEILNSFPAFGATLPSFEHSEEIEITTDTVATLINFEEMRQTIATLDDQQMISRGGVVSEKPLIDVP